MKFFFSRGRDFAVEVEASEGRKKIDVPLVSLSLLFSHRGFSSAFPRRSRRRPLLSLNIETNPQEKKGKAAEGAKRTNRSRLLDLDRSRPILFHSLKKITCTVLSGRSSPARRLMCSRRRRLESCSRIFFRAILKKREGKSAPRKKKQRRASQKGSESERRARESLREKEQKRIGKNSFGFLKITSRPPARPPSPP